MLPRHSPVPIPIFNRSLSVPKLLFFPQTLDVRYNFNERDKITRYSFTTPMSSANRQEIAFHLFFNHKLVDSIIMNIPEKKEVILPPISKPLSPPKRTQDQKPSLLSTSAPPALQIVQKKQQETEVSPLFMSLKNSGQPFVTMQMMLRKGCNSPWEPTNFLPDKIGKMRKLKFHLYNLSFGAAITAVSSDPNVVQVLLSNANRRISDNASSVTINVPVNCMDQPYHILIDPKSKNANATISVYLVIYNPERSVVSLYKHCFTTAGHKYESGKRALHKSTQNSEEQLLQIRVGGTIAYHPEQQVIPNPLSEHTTTPNNYNKNIFPSSQYFKTSTSPAESETDEDDTLIIDESQDNSISPIEATL